MTQTALLGSMVALNSDRTAEAKSADFVSALDYGATIGGNAGTNTTAINAAIAACNSGFVVIPPGMAYTEASLVMDDTVVLIIFGSNSTITYLTKNQGDGVGTAGGIIVKAIGDTGVLIKTSDYGVTAEPIIQFCDATTGDAAAMEAKFLECTEISDPTAPSANKSRLYTKDNGGGKTQLVVRFPTGAVQVIATEP